MRSPESKLKAKHLDRLWKKGILPKEKAIYDEIGKKQDKPTIGTVTIPADGWKTEDGETFYSFEETYPFAQYDISIEPDGESVTDAQMKAWGLAKPTGSPTANRVILKGTTPEIGIPIIVKVVRK